MKYENCVKEIKLTTILPNGGTYQGGCEHGAGLDEEGDDGADDDGEVTGEPRHVRDLRVQGLLHHLRHLGASFNTFQHVHIKKINHFIIFMSLN